MTKKKILIIEDDRAMLDEIYNFFHQKNEFELRKSSHGEEGLTLITVFRPDLVILDVMLPEIDGFEICKNILEMPPEMRPQVILLTALSALLNKMEASWLNKTGAKALFTKPVNYEKLLAQIQELLKE